MLIDPAGGLLLSDIRIDIRRPSVMSGFQLGPNKIDRFFHARSGDIGKQAIVDIGGAQTRFGRLRHCFGMIAKQFFLQFCGSRSHPDERPDEDDRAEQKREIDE